MAERPPPGPVRLLLLTALAALAASGAATAALFGRDPAGEWLAGWAVAAAQGAAAVWINHRAVGRDTRSFLLWGMGANLLRLAVVLASVWGFWRLGLGRFGPFATAVGVGFFCFMAGEVVSLHARSAAGGLKGDVQGF